MQLIVETETALDIERNMSTAEDIKNTIVDNLMIEEQNENKFNGNKINNVNETAQDNGDKQETNEIKESLTNCIPVNADNNEEELNKVDLSEMINKQNIVEADVAQVDESQEYNSAKETNGIDNVEKYRNNEPEEIPEEDYLEDDIISIRDEAYNINSEPRAEPENEVTTVDETMTVMEDSHGDDKTEALEEIKKSHPIKDNTIIDEDKDVIEVIEDESQDSNNQIETEQPTGEEKDDIEFIEELQDSPAPYERGSKPSIQKETDDIELIEESQDSTVQDDKESEPITINEKEEVDEIEESNFTSVNETGYKKESAPLILEDEPSKARESKANFSPEDPKENNVDDIVKEKDNSLEIPNDVLNEREDISDHSMGEGKNINESVATIALNESNPKISIKEENDTNMPKESNKNKNKYDMVVDEIKVEQLEETEVAPILQEIKTESTDLTVDEIESTKIVKDSKDESSKCVSTTLNTNDSCNVVKKDVAMDVEEIIDEVKTSSKGVDTAIELKDDMDVEELAETTTISKTEQKITKEKVNAPVNKVVDEPVICKLSNTLDILSDDDEEEEPAKEEPPHAATPEVETSKVNAPKSTDTKEKQCINIEDDDDIMVIDEDTNKAQVTAPVDIKNKEQAPAVKSDVNTDSETGEKTTQQMSDQDKNVEKEKAPSPVPEIKDCNIDISEKEKVPEASLEKPASPPPLVPDNFLSTAKKKLSDMTRDELEEFCVLKIVESIVDRSSLSDIKNKLKTMTQGLEDYRKKTATLIKQNRDLQVVLKSVQEEQKKAMGDTPITPLKITRSVGMQVFMEKTVPRKKVPQQSVVNKPTNNQQNKTVMSHAPRPQKPPTQQIPVPRLVPANNPALKTPSTVPLINQMNIQSKNVNPPNGVNKNASPAVKAEKRQHNKIASSVTVDLTDDEPPAKMPGGSKTSPAPPVRLVPPQNLMAPQRQPFGPGVNSPRKVYIPISGPQNQTPRPGQTIMLKAVPVSGIRPRCSPPQVSRVEPNAVRMTRVVPRHPAPLPSGMKQYQPPNWKGLPPAPDLKLSKVENGIVISWKIEGVPEDTYEEIASYQLYAYQETSTPPSTALWKKIGDVKALPLPMACTLTQFMAGFKYYFAVRAVDVRSRLGPFSLPGSILLLSKNI